MTQALFADVCVIGAGAGGAVVAAELAQGGAKVILLEQGLSHSVDSFTARPPQMLAQLYRDGGQTLTIGNPPIVLPLGKGLGGTTLVNSGTCFRTPPHVLQAWRERFGLHIDQAELSACFLRVEEALSVKEVTPQLAGANAAVARRGAEALSWSHGYLKRNAKGCVGSGVCAFGCPTSAKQHTGITYVPKAVAAGAQVITGADVKRIVMRAGKPSHIEAVLSAEGKVPLQVRCKTVIVATGTIHTPGLLHRSGLKGESSQLGCNLSLHPATAVFGLMEERVDMAKGVPQSFYIDEFAQEGIMFEGIAGPPSYAAMSLPLKGEAHAAAMARYPYLSQFGLMVSDSSRGRVRSVPKLPNTPLITYDLDQADLQRFRDGLQRLREMFFAAGAKEVYLPLPQGVEPQDAQRGDLRLMAFHPLGTARADADPAAGVVDENLAVHGVEGVYVADGSVVPSSLGVNPQLTIMGLATRLAFHLLKASPPNPHAHIEEIHCPS